MAEIMLANNRGIVKIDDEDLERVTQYKWHLYRNPKARTVYAITRTNGVDLRMHRLILGARKGEGIDHVNHDGLDNRRENLRMATTQQNTMNKRSFKNPGNKGAYYDKKRRQYRAQLMYNRQRHNGPRRPTRAEAAQDYNRLAERYFGEFACLNETA